MLTLPELLGAAVVAGRAALPELLETARAKKLFMAPRFQQNLEPILSSIVKTKDAYEEMMRSYYRRAQH